MRTFLILLFLAVQIELYAQNFGYFGKKNIIDINLLMSHPLIFNIDGGSQRTKYIDITHSSYTTKKTFLDFSLNINYIRSIKRGLSLGFEFERKRIEVAAPNEFEKVKIISNYGSNLYLRYTGLHELLVFDYQYIIPKVEFSNDESIFGVGINHQIGIGIGRINFQNNDNNFLLKKFNESTFMSDNLTNAEIEEFKTNFYDFSQNKFKLYIITYSINFRKPISKFLMFNYGFKYNLSYVENFVNRNYTYEQNNTYWLSRNQVTNIISGKVMTNILQFKIGLNLVF
jgi:hypothetical protein